MPNLGYMKGRVLKELKEDEDPDLIAYKISDAVEALWEAVLLVNIQSFIQGPVQNIQFNTGDLRKQIVSINNPTIAPIPATTPYNNALAQRILYFAYTYVTQSGSETLPSPIANIAVAPNFLAQVPPPPLPALNPVGSIGWNLYASDNPNGRMALQNAQPLDYGVAWQEDPVQSIIDDPDLPASPLSNTTADNLFYIKFFEVQNVDTTWTRWEGADITSLMFQRAQRNLPVASTYESYAWDVLNNNQIEIRPQAGMQLNPQYFYVAKPYRLRFDNSPLPFVNMAVEEFLINFAVSRIKLVNEEYEAHKIWEGLADKKKLQSIEAIADQNVARQSRITPYMYW